LKGVSDVPEEVQMCCCELSESEYHREKQQKESGGKTSEKIGTYSVGFASAQESATAISREQRQHCYETGLASYRSVLSGGVICISMRM
jgi:hypothetical protein